MTYNDYDQKTLDALHKVQLEILDKFVSICQKYDLTYFLVGGTLLGAVRHKGFIPWDDDIDVGMSRHDYDLFVKYAESELKDEYYLDCFKTNNNYYLPFAKIRKNGTIFDEVFSHSLNNHKGIFIDIFPFENIEKNIFTRISAIFIKSMLYTIFYKNGMCQINKTIHPILVRILSIFSAKRIMVLQEKLLCFNKNDNTKYISALSGSYSYNKETILRSTVFPVKEVEFEGKKYYGMNDCDKYLKSIYGDYMKLPPIEKRVNHMPLKIDFGKNK